MPNAGLIFVTSKVKDPSRISDERYNDFYNSEHLPDVLGFFGRSGIKNAFALRYKKANTDADVPYLALYPVPDAQWLLSTDLGQLEADTKKSKVLDVDNIHEAIDIRPRIYEKTQTFEGVGHATKTGVDRGKTLISAAMEPGPSPEQEQDFEDWYRKQHLDMISMVRNYRRTTRYKRIDGGKPNFLALHEYACRVDEIAIEQITQSMETEWGKTILEECETYDWDVWELVEVQEEAREKL